jgi:hypothetical protein
VRRDLFGKALHEIDIMVLLGRVLESATKPNLRDRGKGFTLGVLVLF